MDRRKFCLSSAAAAISGTAIAISGGAAGWACTPAAAQMPAPLPPAAGPILPLYKFVYDRRYSAGRAFGAAAEAILSTAGIAAIDGDITALWSRDLREQWSAGGGAIAGMTTARTLFCLEQLAGDHWMRVVIRAEHTNSDGRGFVHRLTASAPMISQIEPALTAVNWPAKMPAVLAACQDANRAPRMTCMTESKGDYCWAARDEKLMSFVIA